MGDLELETQNTVEIDTQLIATPHDLGPGQLKDFKGGWIFEVKPGTTLLNSQHSTFGGIFARGSQAGPGLIGEGTNNVGVHGRSSNGVGVWGHSSGGHVGVLGDSPDEAGVHGTSTSGPGVRGTSTSGPGVTGTSTEGPGVSGTSAGGPGVRGVSSGTALLLPPGVEGQSDNGTGVIGRSNTREGVVGVSMTGVGVHGESDSNTGVNARSNSGIGVYSRTKRNIGVYGESETNEGVYGFTQSGIGVRGGTAFGSDTSRAASFRGPVDLGGHVDVFGNFTVVTGNKQFKIDHPLDPENKYLLHNCVESSDMKNIYDGVARLDKDGAAWVYLPEWFEALNGDLRYQLTAVGGAAPDLHVAEEISENRFRIAGGHPGMKVCWQVTGARKDPWALANPFEVEQEKPQRDRGCYLQPDLYDAPEEQRVWDSTRASAQNRSMFVCAP